MQSIRLRMWFFVEMNNCECFHLWSIYFNFFFHFFLFRSRFCIVFKSSIAWIAFYSFFYKIILLIFKKKLKIWSELWILLTLFFQRCYHFVFLTMRSICFFNHAIVLLFQSCYHFVFSIMRTFCFFNHHFALSIMLSFCFHLFIQVNYSKKKYIWRYVLDNEYAFAS